MRFECEINMDAAKVLESVGFDAYANSRLD